MKKKLISVLITLCVFSIINFVYATEPIFFYDSGVEFTDEAGLYASLSDVTNFAQTNVAEEIDGNWEIQDNIHFSFGDDDDFSFRHNTTSTNYEIVNAANSVLWWLTPAGEVGTITTANPYIALYDSNAAGADRADEFTGMLTGGFSTTTEDAEISDWALTSMGCATAGTEYTNLFWDGSDSHLYMGVFVDYSGANPSVAPAAVANYESIYWDFDYAATTVALLPKDATTDFYSTLDFEIGGLAVNGGQSYKKTNVADAAYGTSALTTDYIVAWTSISAARAAVISTEDEDSGTATLPRVMIFKDQTGNAASYNITISLESGGNIDGAATYVLNKPYQFVTLEIDGTNAYTIGGN